LRNNALGCKDLPPLQGGRFYGRVPGVKDDMSRQLAARAAKLSAL
jgi:hypothetical protein